MDKSMNHFGAACASGPVELRIRHLDALCLMMSKFSTTSDSEILNRWFNDLGEPFPELILSYLKKPFVDLRISTLNLLAVLMNFEWARKIFFHTPGLVEIMIKSILGPIFKFKNLISLQLQF